MARKIKFALEMKDGEQVRNIEDLRKYFDLDKTVGYFISGKLLTWLNDRYYDEEAEAIENLAKDDPELNKKICQILGVEFEEEAIPEIDPEFIALRNKRLAKLKQYTADNAVLDKVDLVAFNQEELADLLDENKSEIYLCQNKFVIPLRQKNKKYIGIGKVEAVIKSKTKVNFEELNIKFVNISLDKDYKKMIERSSKEFLKLGNEAKKKNDFDEAINLYKKAIEYGNVEAICLIGYIYDNDKYDKKDKQKAIEWLEKAANLGNTGAMNTLGVIYDNGNEVERDYLKAVYWYKKAAELGNEVAMSNLGLEYEYGDGVEKDYSKAVYWYKKAAELGNEVAMERLGLAYEYGDGVEKNYSKAVYWFQKAAELGNKISMTCLGDAYKHGDGVEKDYSKAVYWYKKAAELGNKIAMSRLGDRYIFGEGVEKDSSKAVYWWKKAADVGEDGAMTNLGIAYRDGDGVKQDYSKAKYWFEEAAKKNNTYAMRQLAALHSRTYYPGVRSDVKYWLEKAVALGDKEAERDLAKFNTPKKDDCFITTAVCNSFNKPDNCYELTMFRDFRDTWLKNQKDGMDLIKQYYEIAPSIVKNIDLCSNAQNIYLSIWNEYLKPCLHYLEANEKQKCKDMYIKMVQELYRKFY